MPTVEVLITRPPLAPCPFEFGHETLLEQRGIMAVEESLDKAANGVCVVAHLILLGMGCIAGLSLAPQSAEGAGGPQNPALHPQPAAERQIGITAGVPHLLRNPRGRERAIALNRCAIVEVRLGWNALTRSEIVDSDARGAVLKIEVSSTSFKTGVAHEYGCRHRAASAHDRGHERAQALCGHAEGSYPRSLRTHDPDRRFASGRARRARFTKCRSADSPDRRLRHHACNRDDNRARFYTAWSRGGLAEHIDGAAGLRQGPEPDVSARVGPEQK
jgi:hypothetical protein